MLNSKTISDLNKAFTAAPGGFVVVDQGLPRFVVLDYETYKKLKIAKKPLDAAKGKILVTGGAGYIGSHAVKVLQDEGYQLVVYDNLSTGLKERIKNCTLVVADLADKAALNKVFKEEQIDAVLHFAASIEAEESVINPSQYFQNNVINGLNLLDAMIEHGVSKLVFSSSAAVYGEPLELPITEACVCSPINAYGESKLMFERMLKWYNEAYGLHSISLRYFNAAGAWPEEGLGYKGPGGESHLIPNVLNVAAGKAQEIIVNGQDYQTADGTCIRDYVHVLDLASAHLSALKKLEKVNGAYVYNVGSGAGYSILDVIEEAVEITGRMIPIRFGPRRVGDPAKLVADTKRIQKDFGWEPKHDLKSILESSWAWQKENNK